MKLVFATHNDNKLKELQALIPSTITLQSLTEIGCVEEIIENAATIEGNALIKARYVVKRFEMNCFADDTGLEIEALNGEPGVYSARYAGEEKDSVKNMTKVLTALEKSNNRNAQFKTVIALIFEGKEYTFEGICKGVIIKKPIGDSGFGYDPIFKPEGYEQTFAQMPLTLKNKIGHRGKAVQKLVDFLRNKM